MKRLVVKHKIKSQCLCNMCGKDITFDFKVHKFRKNYHLNCYKKWLESRLNYNKLEKKEIRRELEILKKHGSKLVLEGLQREE